MRLEISNAARADIDNIHSFGEQQFGRLQADVYLAGLIDAFDLLCVAPAMNATRPEFGADVRMHFYKSYLVFYQIQSNTVMIRRILSRYENWPKLRV
jgi:toxin ParE1/3/4